MDVKSFAGRFSRRVPALLKRASSPRPEPSRRLGVAIVVAAVMALVTWSGCRTTPFTGRKQLLLMPEKQEIALGVAAYQEVIAKEPASTNPHYIQLVNRVGDRIARVAGRPDYQWEFRVIASKTQNAFALPGGKVAIYEGILPVCVNEAGLAVVISHEIAHVLARHGGERMTQSAVTSGVSQAIDIATQDEDERDRKLLLSVYGAASQYGFVLPYSRKHETEADYIGLMLMAKAGYDPNAAPEFWEQFAAQKTGGQPPEFLSTHPADDRRAGDLRSRLPEAMTHYNNSPVKHGRGETIAAQTAAAH